ncbi:MAG TPA: radical SAM protein [Stellaceae bacterium]|nr:radical SAM protein [Stellaceae bacterium]
MTILHRHVRIEAASHCQLKCPSCPTATGAIDAAIPRGFLRAADFAKLLDDHPWLSSVELSNYGEPFLNPQLGEILEIAHRHDVAITIGNGANLNHARDDVIEALVKYQVRTLTCSIDGASDETYRVYRVGGDFDTVIANIRAINAHKQTRNSELPALCWQFVVFGHNEHEIPKARALAAELSMAFRPKLNWDANFSPVRDAEFVRRETGIVGSTREEYQRTTGVAYAAGICHQLWNDPQINSDGKVLGCCRNFWGDFGGNVFTDGLVRGLNHEKMTYARSMLQGHTPERADIPCTTCDIYHWRRDNAQWLEKTP